MTIGITAEEEPYLVNELGQIIVFGIAFLAVMGGIAYVAYRVCNGNVHLMSLDFWKGIGKIQCR